MQEELSWLLDVYYNKEPWHEGCYLSISDAIEHYSKMIRANQIVFEKDGDRIIGYIEVWFLDNDQVARILSNITLEVTDENLTDGEIVYVSSIYVDKDYHDKGVARRLSRAMKDIQKNNKYVGIIIEEAKRGKRFRLFRRERKDGWKENN